ncbi:MAG: hypothetical protein GY782_01935 [Gammaproteobacteria bacterium]|nr:hypothetical protein [Gammaproteobacteria bacterium]
MSYNSMSRTLNEESNVDKSKSVVQGESAMNFDGKYGPNYNAGCYRLTQLAMQHKALDALIEIITYSDNKAVTQFARHKLQFVSLHADSTNIKNRALAVLNKPFSYSKQSAPPIAKKKSNIPKDTQKKASNDKLKETRFLTDDSNNVVLKNAIVNCEKNLLEILNSETTSDDDKLESLEALYNSTGIEFSQIFRTFNSATLCNSQQLSDIKKKIKSEFDKIIKKVKKNQQGKVKKFFNMVLLDVAQNFRYFEYASLPPKSFVERRPYLFAALLSFPIAPLFFLGYRFYRKWKYEEELTWKMGLLLGFAGLTNLLTGPMLFGFTVAHHGWKNWAPFDKPWLGKTAAVMVAIIGIALTTLSILGALAATGVIAVGTTLYAIGAAASHIPVISQLGNLIANQVVAEVVVTTAASNTPQTSILLVKTTTGAVIEACCCSDKSENVLKKYSYRTELSDSKQITSFSKSHINNGIKIFFEEDDDDTQPLLASPQ